MYLFIVCEPKSSTAFKYCCLGGVFRIKFASVRSPTNQHLLLISPSSCPGDHRLKPLKNLNCFGSSFKANFFIICVSLVKLKPLSNLSVLPQLHSSECKMIIDSLFTGPPEYTGSFASMSLNPLT